MDILNKDKKMDLLSLENFVAENSDIICVMPESPGSLVELGAFRSKNYLNILSTKLSRNTYQKLFVEDLIFGNRKKDKS